jgi:hypothetical protein
LYIRVNNFFFSTLLSSIINHHLSSIVFGLTGNPVQNDPRFSNLEAMMRIYIGIHNRLTDVSVNTTYHAAKITPVVINNWDFCYLF